MTGTAAAAAVATVTPAAAAGAGEFTTSWPLLARGERGVCQRGLAAAMASTPESAPKPPGGREEQNLSLDGLPALTFEQKWKWALM